MIADIHQPANHWLADAVQNFDLLLKEGEDPSFTITMNKCVIEIRLIEAPGVFMRHTISIEPQSENKAFVETRDNEPQR